MPMAGNGEPTATRVAAVVVGVGELAAATRRMRINAKRQVCEVDSD